MRLGIKGRRTVEETAAAEHNPARLQLFISTIHKTPAQTCYYFYYYFTILIQYLSKLKNLNTRDIHVITKQKILGFFWNFRGL